MWRLLSLEGGDPTQNPELREMAGAMSKSEIAEAESSASEWLAKYRTHDPGPTLLMLH
jgi:hypothetical protein